MVCNSFWMHNDWSCSKAEACPSLSADMERAVAIAAAAALLKHENEPQDLLAPIKNGFKSKNEWTRLQAALVADDYSFIADALENTIEKQKESDPNKYVVRVVNHALNSLNKTSFIVR